MKKVVCLLLVTACGSDSSKQEVPSKPNDVSLGTVTVLGQDTSFYGAVTGFGFNSYLGFGTDPGTFGQCVTSEIVGSAGSKIDYGFFYVKDNTELDRYTDSSFNLSLTLIGATEGGKAVVDSLSGGIQGGRKKISDTKITEERVWAIITANKLFPARFMSDPRIDIKKYSADRFALMCGDSFIAGMQKGVKVYALMSCSYTSTTQKNELIETMKANAGYGRISGSADMAKTIKDTMIIAQNKCEFRVQASGLSQIPVINKESPEAFANSVISYVSDAKEEDANPVTILSRKYRDIAITEESQYWDDTHWDFFEKLLNEKKVMLDGLIDRLRDFSRLSAQGSATATQEVGRLSDVFAKEAKTYYSCARTPLRSGACGVDINPGDLDPL